MVSSYCNNCNSVGKNDQCTANQNAINKIIEANNDNSISPQFMNGQPNVNIFCYFKATFSYLGCSLSSCEKEKNYYSGTPLKRTPLGPTILSAVARVSLAQGLVVDHALL